MKEIPQILGTAVCKWKFIQYSWRILLLYNMD